MLEDQSQTVYSQWKSYWDNQYRINTDNPLGKSLRETFFKRYLYGTIFDFLAYQFTILTPLIIYFICRLLEDRPGNMTFWSVIWLIVTPLCRFLRSFFDAQGIYQLGVLGSDISNCVALGMVNKSLQYSTLCNKKFKMG